MNLYEIKLNIKNYATIKLYTKYESVKDKLSAINSSIKRTIPITDVSVSIVDYSDIDYCDSVIIFNSSKKRITYDKNNNVAILNIKENEIRFSDLTYVLLAMFSKKLSENKKYLIHSSSLVTPNNEGIILVGDANAGKTSLAYELMSRHKCKLISNDHSVVGIEDKKAKLFGGTKDIQMRLGAIELYFPELFEKINMSNEDKWNKKLVVNDYINQDLILNQNNDNATLKNVYSISTAEMNYPFIRKKDKVDQFLFLYESFSRIIKGTYDYIIGLDYPMPSMENEENINNLKELCKVIIEQGDVYEAKGSVSSLAKILVKTNDK